jgi:hypothetical protein
MAFRFNKALFHVGNPLKAKPHHDMSVIQRFIRENPEWAVIIVVDSEQERLDLEKSLADMKLPEFHPGGFVVAWENDAAMIDCFCADLQFLRIWNIVGPAWYECDNGHAAASTLKEPRTECPECKSKEMKFIQLDEKKCEKFSKLLGNAITLCKFDTRSSHVLMTLVNPEGNVMQNMPYALGLPQAPALRMEAFSGSGKGKVAFCVSAGPSLKHAIPHLRRLQDNAVIIAVARTFKRLRAEGIRVDYALECEMFDWCSPITEDLTKEEVGDTILLYPPVCAPKTVAGWKGKTMCVFDPPSATLLNRMPMTGGNSVSHHIYNFAAEILKCDKVVLVGQDLSYTEPSGETHAEGTTPDKWPKEAREEDGNKQYEAWAECQTENGPFHPSTHRGEALVAAGAIVPVGPTQVRTSPSYLCFRDLLDILIQRVKVKTYNACPNGLKINNAKYVDLSTLTRLEELA